MAIATGLAIAAGVSAAAGIGGSILAGKAQKKAAATAAGAAQQNTAANNALAREMYGQNAARLDPYAAGGLRAQNLLQGALGMGGAPAGALGGGFGTPMTGGGTNPRTAWTEGALNAMLAVTGPVRSGKAMNIGDPEARLRYLQSVAHPDERAAYQAYLSQNPVPSATATPATGTPATGTAPAQTPEQGALAAYNAFKQSANYDWNFKEGQNALEMSRLPGGGYDSGATRKGILEYGQNTSNNFISQWMDRLAGQQGIGMSAASALAGVGQNMVGQVTANNNSGASAAANAALMQGNANANMWGGIAGSVGNAIGALGSSFNNTGSSNPGPGYGYWGAP